MFPKSLLETTAVCAVIVLEHSHSLQPEVISCQSGIVNLEQGIGIVSCLFEDLEGDRNYFKRCPLLTWLSQSIGEFIFMLFPSMFRKAVKNTKHRQVTHVLKWESFS